MGMVRAIAVALLVSTQAWAVLPEQDQMALADGLFRRGFFADAAREYEQYVSAYPQGPKAATAWYRLGESRYAQAEFAEAREAFGQYLEREPQGSDADRARLRQGEIFVRLGEGERGQATLEALAVEASDASVRAGALYYLGKHYYESQRMDEARTVLARLLEDMPDSPLAVYGRYQLAYVLLGTGDRENAAAEFSAVAASEGPVQIRAESSFRAAEVYDSIGWYDAAVTAYGRLLDEFPESSHASRARIARAWSLYHADRFEEAATAAGALLDGDAAVVDTAALYYLLGNCRQQLKDYSGALEAFNRVLTDHGNSAYAERAAYKRAWCFYFTGNPDQAFAESEAFVAERPDSSLRGNAAFLSAQILDDRHDYEGALERYRALAEAYPESEFAAEALFRAGECAVLLNRHETAAPLFEAFAERHAAHALAQEAQLRAADSRFFSTDFEQAVVRYLEVLEAGSEGDLERDTLHRLASTYHNMGRIADSADTFRTLLEKYPEGVHVVEAHLRLGHYLLRDGDDPVAAIAHFEHAHSRDPDGDYAGRALAGLGLARYKTRDLGGAEETLLQVIRQHASVYLNQELYIWLGQTLFDASKFPESAEVLTALLEAYPEYPAPERIRYKIAEALESAGDTARALAGYGAVLQSAPQSSVAVEARFRMAALHEQTGDLGQALGLYEEAAAASNGDTGARARFRVAEIHESREDWDSAARNYMLVAILFLHEELTPRALLHAGTCYEKLGKQEQANAAYEELASEFPESDAAKTALERLGRQG